MLIDVSYSISGPRHIENASTSQMPGQNSLAVNEAINGYIEFYQREYLSGILGEENVQAIVDYLELLEQEKEQESGDNEEKEVSKFELVCSQLRDSFANYVFFYILRDMNEQATITGLVRLKCTNEYVAPIRRQVSIWNDMVKKHEAFMRWSFIACPFPVTIDKNLLTTINTFNL